MYKFSAPTIVAMVFALVFTGFGIGLVTGQGIGHVKAVELITNSCYDKKEYVLEDHGLVKLTLKCSVVLE